MSYKKQADATKFETKESKSSSPFATKESPTTFASTKGKRTKITIKFDAGFGNNIFIRGSGANLNWDKGMMLKNVRADEWVWETETPFNHCEFKILLNDTKYEAGENHHLNSGATIQYTPRF